MKVQDLKFLIPFSICLLARGPGFAQCQVNPSSIINAFAGMTGAYGYTGDGGPATAAKLSGPYGLAFDAAGNLYIADFNNSVIRKVNTAGIMSTVAGNGTSGYTGDGGPATSAELEGPVYIAFDSLGNLYISDWYASVIRKITPAGIISTYAGTGVGGNTGDGGLATAAQILPWDLAVDQFNNVIFTETSYHVIRRITPAGIISTIAGTGTEGYAGDGGPATAALLAYPESVAFDPGASSVYFWDDDNYVIRKIDSCGVITTFAGNGTRGYSGDGGPALAAQMDDIHGLAIHDGTFYAVDIGAGAVRTIDNCRNIHTLAGTGTNYASPGNGGSAYNATFQQPLGIAFDASNNLYVGEVYADTVRVIAVNCSPTPTPVCVITATPTPACTQPITPTPTPTNSFTPTFTPSITNTITKTFTNTITYTPTRTFTSTPTSTITNTATITQTYTPTLTATATPSPTPTCVIYAWPDPYNPAHAVSGWFNLSCIPAGATVSIFTISGELIADPAESGGMAQWNGRNRLGFPVSTGIYFYVVQLGNKELKSGKFLLTTDH